MYDIKWCVDYQQEPYFGYATQDYEPKNSIAFHKAKPAIVAREREDWLQEHVKKCFTYGKKVVRTNTSELEDTRTQQAKIDEFQKKFNRIGLVRKFYSKKRDQKNKKFDFPVDTRGKPQAEIEEN